MKKFTFLTNKALIAASLFVGIVSFTATSVLSQERQSGLDNEADAIINDLSLTSRVLGGGDAEPGEWPSVVAIVRPGTFALENRFFCGGTVVADRWVMTAAHCLYNGFGNVMRPSALRVVAGINDLRNDIPQEETVVTNIFVHPEYDNSLELPPNDIALLELGSVINAPPTELFSLDTENFTDRFGFIVGWGATRYVDQNNATYPNLQQDASVPLVSLNTCNSEESYQGLVTDKQVCAGFREGGVDTCAGDSGGPLFLLENGEPVQVGITSFGFGCAEPNFYGIYTNVSRFIPWLGDYIDVPDQTTGQGPGVVDERELTNEPGVAVNNDDSDDGGWFGAAIQPVSGLVMALFLLMRRVRSRFN